MIQEHFQYRHSINLAIRCLKAVVVVREYVNRLLDTRYKDSEDNWGPPYAVID